MTSFALTNYQCNYICRSTKLIANYLASCPAYLHDLMHLPQQRWNDAKV
jgi:hypothetical protein